MTQASWPRRWIRNRRPASTSSRILEKERLAFVAEMRRSRPVSGLSGLSDFRAMNLILSKSRPHSQRVAIATIVSWRETGSAGTKEHA